MDAAGPGEDETGRKVLTTPPPPSKELFAALTIDVTWRSVIEVRIKATLELNDADGSGIELSDGGGCNLEDP